MKTESAKNEVASTECDARWTQYFTGAEWTFYVIFIVLGLLVRWTLLDMRPYHHDESLHGMYGRYFYDFPNINFYKYDPMLHGPMLYNSMRFIYAMFGDSLWAARTPPCIMGSLFMLAPFVFRRYFTKSAVLALTAAVALSPTLVYWSRFLREDYWVVSGMLLVAYGFTLAPDRLKAFFVMFGICIQWCTKENYFVTFALFFGYLVFESFFRFIILKDNESLVTRIVRYIGTHPWETCWAFIFSFFVFCWFYSAGFRYPDGIIEGLGKKGYDYWMEHHKKERIEGPFNFPLYMLGWYELPFLLAYFLHIGLFFRRASREIQIAGAVVFLMMITTVTWYLLNEGPVKGSAFGGFFKLKDVYDVAGLFIVLFFSPIATIQYLFRRQYGLAACGYFCTATFFMYCYVGEKVPWLSMYPLIFGLPYLALFYQNYFTQYPFDYKNVKVRTAFLWSGCFLMALGLFFIAEEWRSLKWPINGESPIVENSLYLAIGALLTFCALCDHLDRYLGTVNLGRLAAVVVAVFLLRATIQTNFVYAGKETEYISQVHTTYDTAEAAQRIVDDIIYERRMYKPKVLVTGEATWPLSWYFRGLREEYKFSATPEEKKNFTFIFQDVKEGADDTIPEGYTVRKLNLRGWWVPDFSQMTLKKFLNFSINHYPWGPSGFTYTNLLVAKDESRFLNK